MPQIWRGRKSTCASKKPPSFQSISSDKKIAIPCLGWHFCGMNFPVDGKKATQAAARLIEKSGGPIDYLRLVKLAYLADREAIQTRGIPIIGGHYFSMRKGPTISEVMNFVQQRNAPEWKSTISPRHGNEIRLERTPKSDALSESELKILDETVLRHLNRTTDELVEWCHKNCSEYEHTSAYERKPIHVESLLKAAKKSPRQIQKIVREAASLERLEELLA
ncbi:MAG TPA: Panacea domain-containing protein [Verrucomicrobiae bacterium]|jgi:hypothetical protein|nr:Panacea domain-containing protein [Verrucomicrobiae bacterium]